MTFKVGQCVRARTNPDDRRHEVMEIMLHPNRIVNGKRMYADLSLLVSNAILKTSRGGRTSYYIPGWANADGWEVVPSGDAVE